MQTLIALKLAGTLTGVIGAVGAVASLMAASAALLQARKNQKAVIEVHAIVNSRTTDLTKRVEQLSEALQEAGTKIPQSPPATPPN